MRPNPGGPGTMAGYFFTYLFLAPFLANLAEIYNPLVWGPVPARQARPKPPFFLFP